MRVSSDQISHTEVTRCPFCHLQNSFETFLIFTPFFGLRGEERQQKLSSGRQSPLSLRLLVLSFRSPIISYLFPFLGLFICLTASLTFISAAYVFLFSLFLLKVINSSSNLPSCSIFPCWIQTVTMTAKLFYMPHRNTSRMPNACSIPERVSCSSDLLLIVLITNAGRLEGNSRDFLPWWFLGWNQNCWWKCSLGLPREFLDLERGNETLQY